MTIDKQKLQKLLWGEAASFRADCADWKRNTEALQEFLGEKTVEEVALELLAENNRLGQIEYAFSEWIEKTDWVQSTVQASELGRHRADVLRTRIDQLKAENETLRKDAERYRWLQRGHSGYIEVVEWIGPHATGMAGEDLDALVDGAKAKAVQP
ncbi:hypothetical protein [Pseudomonas atacamensis]|uniref:hypothetical protein n=1 Tax=Pseudomonas atacamensis TaxID=2565368 RepID=UPI0034506E83